MNPTLIPALIATLLGAALITGMLRRTRRTRRTLRQEQLDSLGSIRRLLQLMSLIQQHRGLVSRLLNGEDGIRTALTEKQRAIAEAQRNLQDHYDPRLMTPGRWQRINSYWQELGTRLSGLSPQESFESHSTLIRQILFLIGDVAEQGRLQELPDSEHHLSALWTELPATAEAIGQARAVGAGVAAACHCDSVARIKLRFLRQQVEESLRGLATGMATDDLGMASGFSQKVGHLLAELEQHLLLPATPTITAEHYFRIASEALESVYAVCDRTTSRLEQRLTTAPR